MHDTVATDEPVISACSDSMPIVTSASTATSASFAPSPAATEAAAAEVAGGVGAGTAARILSQSPGASNRTIKRLLFARWGWVSTWSD